MPLTTLNKFNRRWLRTDFTGGVVTHAGNLEGYSTVLRTEVKRTLPEYSGLINEIVTKTAGAFY